MLSKTFQEQDNPEPSLITAFIAAEDARLSGRADWRSLADTSIAPELQTQMSRLLDCLELLQAISPTETDQDGSNAVPASAIPASALSSTVNVDLKVAIDVVAAAGYVV
jgi:hypothetical protein